MTQLNQQQLSHTIMAELLRQNSNLPFEKRIYDCVIKASTSICDELNKPIIKVRKSMGLDEWLKTEDVIRCTKYMAGVLSKQVIPEYTVPDYPRSVSEFGCCVRLLDAVPEFLGKIKYLGINSRHWTALVANWDELTKLYNDDRRDELNKRMQEIYGAALYE